MYIEQNAKQILHWSSYILSTLLYLIGLCLYFDLYHILLLLFGAHLILYSFQVFVSETVTWSILFRIGLFILCLLFCLICREWYFFLLFLTINSYSDILGYKPRRYIDQFLPLAMYLAFQLLSASTVTPIQNMIYALFLLLVSTFYLTVRRLFLKSYENTSRMQELLSRSAMIELQERNLNRELAIKNYLTDRNARLEEREHISRSIHNVVGHTITAAVMALEASELLYDVSAEMAKQKVIVAKERMQQSLDAIRRAVRLLDEEQMAISVRDFSELLNHSINQFVSDTGVKVRHNLSDEFEAVKLPAEHTEFLLEALLEILSNGIRHGNATAFIVMLNCDLKNLQIIIEDNGTVSEAFTEAELDVKLGKGFGLKKIVNYLRNQGGDLKISHRFGWSVNLNLPIMEVIGNE